MAEWPSARSLRFVAACGAALGASSACAPLPGGAKGGGDKAHRHAGPPAALVTAERRVSSAGNQFGGGALVFIDESGRRVADLTSTRGEAVVDRQPTFSPDGRFVGFASNRDRQSPAETSLWVVRATSRGTLSRLTRGKHTDRDPAWGPDGRVIYFSSNRSGRFEVYRLPVKVGKRGQVVAAGSAIQLTRGSGQNLAPSVSPRGDRVVFMRVADDGTSSLWMVPAKGGAAEQLTRGPADVTPTFGPDGRVVYFAARAKGRADSDIFAVEIGRGGKHVVISEPDADQSGPRVSPDGKAIFATAVYRSQATGAPVLASVVVALLDETGTKKPVWRALHDPAAVESRVGVAIAPGRLKLEGLAKNLDYRRGLRRALEKALRDAAAEDARAKRDPH